MIAALTALFRALSAYYELKSLSYLDDREDKLLRELQRHTDEIDRFRSLGDPHSQQRADGLRLVAADLTGQIEHLRARRAEASRGGGGGDG